jgi:L-seryl-tRNA(Ser) seleniumtransferase
VALRRSRFAWCETIHVMAAVDPLSVQTMSMDESADDRQNGDTEAMGRLRRIPPVSTIVALARARGSSVSDDAMTRAARAELDLVRRDLLSGGELSREVIEARVIGAILALETRRLVPVINATGVIVHTNLGRAPVSAETASAMRAAAASAVALEIEPESNERGGRMREINGLIRALTGAEAALVVNNCAAAVLLALAAVAGKNIVVSRGEAIEIGGGFRIPEVLAQSGGRLVEVGTTNRTYIRDYADATDVETGAYLKVHPSNFRLSGFVHSVSTQELAALGRERRVPVLEDLGSGALLDTARYGLAPEPTLTQAIGAGADLVMASGDKLLGGPQAGLILGREQWVERVARHPLARAVRADKTTLAGIAATLRHYARGEAESRVPVWRMIAAAESAIRDRAERVCAALRQHGIDVEVEAVASTVGGGSLPGETLPSWAVMLRAGAGEDIEALARRMRLGDPAVFGRIDRDRLLLDMRSVLPEDDGVLEDAVRGAVC